MLMLKQKMIEEERQNSFMVLKHFLGKLQVHLHPPQFKRADFTHSVKCGVDLQGRAKVPEDVKEGHFAVFAAKTEKPQRFIVELQFLTNPAFLSLLKRAEEEYGFTQKGVLAVPCRPEELQKILQHKVGKHSPAGEYNTHNHRKLKP